MLYVTYTPHEPWIWYTSNVIGEVPNMTPVALLLVTSRGKYMVVNSHRVGSWYHHDRVN